MADDWMYDKRTACWSYMTTMTVSDYLELASEAHAAQGGLTGQRGVMVTTTAKRIRSRMVEDLKKGATLPPVVIGAVLDTNAFGNLPPRGNSSNLGFLPDNRSSLSIIDGMQRTAALQEAQAEAPEVGDGKVRVEFWLTDNVRAMIYRMLILNTGQVPWTISRQLSVVYAPLLSEIRERVPEIDKVSTPDQPGRRVGPAQYSSDALVELYIAFSLRKTGVDTKEALSDEFSRLDFVDNLANEGFQEQFYGVLAILSRLDKAFSRFEEEKDLPGGRFIFDRQPARIGFVVSLGLAILGRPGADRGEGRRGERLQELTKSAELLIERIDRMDPNELGDFLRTDVLQELLDKRVGQVGRYERGIFADAFKVLIEENFDVVNLEQCWRAS
ncbi:hypothetical protein [Rathayibacter sp. VKM Ac-2803]|uniref:hypothetical protein n=1 Tax=Rathayibacter sp. VKM Ac-2803 TaxID=2609256 RepID=UPI00194DFBB2|nr:hypothetical protein [Rathayibacter sp. VKM Ac-2803]